MLQPRRGDFTRGTSVLAALVFVAVLSTIAYGVHSIVPPDTLAQAASARLALGPDDVSGPGATPPDAKPKAELIGDAPRCRAPIELQQDKNAAVKFDAKQDVLNTCVPGCLYQIGEGGEATTIRVRDLCTDGSGANAEKCNAMQCLVQVCDASGECEAVGASMAPQILSTAAGVQPSLQIKSNPDLQKALAEAKAGSQSTYNNLPPYLKDAFRAEQAEAVAQNQERIANNLDAIKEIGTDSPSAREKLESETARLQKENQNLSRVTNAVAGDQASIAPGCGSGLAADGACPSASPDRAPDTRSPNVREGHTFAPATVCGQPGANPDSCILATAKETGSIDDSKKDDRKLPSSAWNPTLSPTEKLKSLASVCPANSTCPEVGLPNASWKPVEKLHLAQGQSDEEYSRERMVAQDARARGSSQAAFEEANQEPQGCPTGTIVDSRGNCVESVRAQEQARLEEINRAPQGCPKGTVPNGFGGCVDPARASEQARMAEANQAQQGCPRGTIIDSRGNCVSAAQVPRQDQVRPPQQPPRGGNPPNPAPAPAPAPAPVTQVRNPLVADPRENQRLTQDIFKGLIQGLTLGTLLNQSQNPYGNNPYGYGGYGYQQQNYNQQTPPAQCPPPPPQPSASACKGSWQQQSAPGPNGLTCVNGWTCVTPPDTTTTAQISCAPLVADVGMEVSISYTCAHASRSVGTNFSTGGALSGIVTSTLGATSTAYSVSCTNDKNETASASCNVQVVRPAIILVANPASVALGDRATIGWVTSGMQSCVVSSPDSAAFTSQNADNTATAGSAQTPSIAGTMRFDLACETVGGSTRAASTTVMLR